MELNITPLALLIVLFGGLTIVFGSRPYVLPALFLVAIMVPRQNSVSLFTLSFLVHRLLVVFAWIRILVRGEHRDFVFTKIDKLLIWYAVWGFTSYVLLWQTFGSVVYKLGETYDILGLFFFFRFMLRNEEDFHHLLRTLYATSLVLGGAMAYEYVTLRNPLAALGTTEAVWSREHTLRCQAAFGHPISAGMFGATLLPLWFAARRQPSPIRRWAFIGLITVTLITITSGSSSSVLAFLSAVIAILLWHWRVYLRTIRWGVVLLLVGLHIVMNAPVWALVARVNIFGGSTGYHRYVLLDRFIRHVGDWWVLGMEDTSQWGALLWDVTNQFVLEGVRGGLVRLMLFVAILVACFREAGRARLLAPDTGKAMLAWSFGAMLFVHCVGFFGYSYWDQIIVLWYLLLAATTGLVPLLGLAEEQQSAEEYPATEPSFAAT